MLKPTNKNFGYYANKFFSNWFCSVTCIASVVINLAYQQIEHHLGYSNAIQMVATNPTPFLVSRIILFVTSVAFLIGIYRYGVLIVEDNTK